MDERAVDQIQLSKMAEALFPEFLPLLLKKRTEALDKMKHMYMAKETEPCLYVAQVAVITAIDEITASIEYTIKRGRHKEKELLNGRQ